MSVVPGDRPASIDRAVEVLAVGGLVAFPTETVYGLGADAERPDAVARVFAAKGRPADHPLIVHLGAAGAVLADEGWAVDVPDAGRLLADAFWPGPLTLLLRRGPRVPDAVTGGRDTVGLRVPDHPVALALLGAFGGGVAAPSANPFGRVSPTTAAHVVDGLGDAVDLVLDGGPCPVGVESTIVDLTGPVPTVLRPGGVRLEDLTAVLGAPPAVVAPAPPGTRSVPAPGMLAAHYAPRARVEVVDDLPALHDRLARWGTGAEGGAHATVGVLAPGAVTGLADAVVVLEPAGPADEYARVLYARLRQADRLGLDVLVCVAPPAVGLGVAVRDRLARAAAGSAAANAGSPPGP